MKKRSLEDWSVLLSGLARPVRMWVWMIDITVVLFYVVFKGGKPDVGGIVTIIIGGMFADFGVSSITRSQEKKTAMKVTGVQKAVETATDPSKNTNIENLNLGNETVNTGKKEEPKIKGIIEE